MTKPSELVAFSASALLSVEGRREAVIASIQVFPSGAVSVIVENEYDDAPLEVLRMPAGSRVYTTESVVAA